MDYSVLIDNIDDNNKPPVVLAIVDEGDPSDLHVALEHLHNRNGDEEEEERNPN